MLHPRRRRENSFNDFPTLKNKANIDNTRDYSAFDLSISYHYRTLPVTNYVISTNVGNSVCYNMFCGRLAYGLREADIPYNRLMYLIGLSKL